MRMRRSRRLEGWVGANCEGRSRFLWDYKQEKQRLCFEWGAVWVEKRVSPLRSLQKAQTAPVEMTGFCVGEENRQRHQQKQSQQL